MRLAVVCLVLIATISVMGCGGSSEPAFTTDSVEQLMSDSIRADLPANTTVDQLECVQDGDDFNYRCRTFARISGTLYTVNVRITCDENTGQCLSEPALILKS